MGLKNGPEKKMKNWACLSFCLHWCWIKNWCTVLIVFKNPSRSLILLPSKKCKETVEFCAWKRETKTRENSRGTFLKIFQHCDLSGGSKDSKSANYTSARALFKRRPKNIFSEVLGRQPWDMLYLYFPRSITIVVQLGNDDKLQVLMCGNYYNNMHTIYQISL